MPRSFALVLIPHSTSDNKIDNAVSRLLDPHASYYDSFEPYRVPCVNCGWNSDEGIKTANEQVGDFHRLWYVYCSLPKDQRPAWESYIADWEQTAINSALSSPDYQQPDTECDMCGGTGIATVTFPVSGLRYESRMMSEDEWGNLGPVEQLTESSDSYEILVTPDGQAHKRWEYQSLSREEWEVKTREILDTHTDCIAIRILVNI